MVDWGKGRYEETAAELEPVAAAVVALAVPRTGERVLDIACGTGNGALLAAAQGADVVGLDSAPRLVGVAQERAAAAGLALELLVGDALALPVEDASFDVVISIFGVIFAPDPGQAMAEVARVLRPGGRAYITAWVPAGPINDMLTVLGRAIGRATAGAPPAQPQRFPWSRTDSVRSIAAPCGLEVATTRHELEIRAASPAAYVDSGRDHPMALDSWPLLERAGVLDTLREEMTGALAAHNEDAPRLLIRSPYVVHELRPAGASRSP
jgi:SAM-dependent methyltransferase